MATKEFRKVIDFMNNHGFPNVVFRSLSDKIKISFMCNIHHVSNKKKILTKNHNSLLNRVFKIKRKNALLASMTTLFNNLYTLDK